MDPRLLKYYNRELQFMREMGAEFAKAYPKIANRLSLDEFECADPYVERLFEGFSFLAARIQLKLDEEFPRFSQHLLERVYPHYLSSIPSMMIVQFQPDLMDPILAEGFLVPRNTMFRSRQAKGIQTACEYRTAHQVNLWPIELQGADYLPTPAAIALAGIDQQDGARAAIRFRLSTTGDIPFEKLALDKLPLHLTGGETAVRAFEALSGQAIRILSPSGEKRITNTAAGTKPVRIQGMAEEEALLPYSPRSFQGYRLLAEYFALPERFMFIELLELSQLLRGIQSSTMELIVLLGDSDPSLEGSLTKDNFLFNCSPAINLFPKRADRIHLTSGVSEYHVVPDRTRPLDYEVYDVRSVKGYGSSATQSQRFEPFYASSDYSGVEQPRAYFALRREPRVLSARQQREGTRSAYIGGEVYLSIVDGNEAPYDSDLRQLGIETLCTNRDLPLHMPLAQGSTDFHLEISTPVNGIRCIGAPTRPRPSNAQSAVGWRLINHLALNYLSLGGEDQQQSTAALKNLLQLYADVGDASMRKQIEGVVSIASRSVNRRLPSPGPITFGRGLEITLVLDESGFEGTGAFLFGAVMEQFFRKYTSINSFTETLIDTLERGTIMRWPARLGLKQTL